MGDAADPNALVQRLHLLRAKRGLTIQQMAELCGIPKSSLESYMRIEGARRPGLDALVAIADGLEVSLDWLAGRAKTISTRNVSEKDYALACFNVVLELVHWMRAKRIGGGEIEESKVFGIDDAEVAAKSMLVFLEQIRSFEDASGSFGDARERLFDDLSKLLAAEQPGQSDD